MSTAAPTTIARIATVALLLFAALLIAIPPAQAASGTTQLTIRLVFPEPPPTATPLSLGIDQDAVDDVSPPPAYSARHRTEVHSRDHANVPAGCDRLVPRYRLDSERCAVDCHDRGA
jgi:hypothetical protein